MKLLSFDSTNVKKTKNKISKRSYNIVYWLVFVDLPLQTKDVISICDEVGITLYAF